MCKLKYILIKRMANFFSNGFCCVVVVGAVVSVSLFPDMIRDLIDAIPSFDDLFNFPGIDFPELRRETEYLEGEYHDINDLPPYRHEAFDYDYYPDPREKRSVRESQVAKDFYKAFKKHHET